MLISGILWLLAVLGLSNEPIEDVSKSTKDEFLDGLVADMTVPELGEFLT